MELPEDRSVAESLCASDMADSEQLGEKGLVETEGDVGRAGEELERRKEDESAEERRLRGGVALGVLGAAASGPSMGKKPKLRRLPRVSIPMLLFIIVRVAQQAKKDTGRRSERGAEGTAEQRQSCPSCGST